MKFDFAIIGSGPAGLTLAKELTKSGFKIALIDRAQSVESSSVNDFFCPYVDNSPSFYTPVFSNQLGGNSALWHSKIYLLSKSEIEKYNWHIDYEELEGYSKKLSTLLDVDNNLINKSEIIENKEYRYSIRAKFRNLFDYFKIETNNKITVFKGYSPIKLDINNELVNKIIIKNLAEEEKIISIKNSVIFCAGGLGNPQLLLNLLSVKNINLGKYLSDHSHVNLGKIIEKDQQKYLKIAKPNIKFNCKIKEQIEIALILKKDKHFSGIQLDYKVDPIRKIRRLFIKIKNLPLRRFLVFFSFFFTKLNGLLYKFGYIIGKYYKYSFEFFFSQEPIIENKVYLSKKKDEFGLNKINIKWKFSENDLNNYNHMIKETIGVNGDLAYFKDKIDFEKNFVKHGLSGLHPSCTTKIGSDKSNGVVDKNLKLFEYKNIYVCGSSVFPFNGFTNPTWTIMTLAFRLSDYLKERIEISKK
tara:strand:- start:556 stop:1968 length:1413 start_codon:yes stop_codon:yes gene_type:complete